MSKNENSENGTRIVGLFNDELLNKFYIREGNCEVDENISIACGKIEETTSSDELKAIYDELKEFEETYPNHELSSIRARQSFLNNPNTPVECIIDISNSKLQYDYMFEYYGGYGGDDYEVTIDLVYDIQDRLVEHNIQEGNKNLEYYKTKKEIRNLKEQLKMGLEFGDSDEDIEMLRSEINFLSAKLESLEIERKKAETDFSNPTEDEILEAYRKTQHGQFYDHSSNICWEFSDPIYKYMKNGEEKTINEGSEMVFWNIVEGEILCENHFKNNQMLGMNISISKLNEYNAPEEQLFSKKIDLLNDSSFSRLVENVVPKQILDGYNGMITMVTYNKIQNNEVVPPGEYSKIDLESEAFKSLDSEVQTTITDYINEQSDKIVNDALEEEKLKQEQSKNTDLEPF